MTSCCFIVRLRHSHSFIGSASNFLYTQPLAGRSYTLFRKQWVFLIGMAVFNLGSLVSAVAQNSPVFIVGRALQGFGYSFVFTVSLCLFSPPAAWCSLHICFLQGVLAISAASMPVHFLPIMTSLMNCAYGGGTIMGPLIGGALTSKLSWRWCFWINLPPGGAAMVIIALWCKPPVVKQTQPFWKRIISMDWPGAGLLLCGTTCLLVALQEGGIRTPWASARIGGLFAGFVVSLLLFLALQVWLGDEASLSMRLLRSRNIGLTSLMNFTCGATYYSILYFVPICEDRVQGSSIGQRTDDVLSLRLPSDLGFLAPAVWRADPGDNSTFHGGRYRRRLFRHTLWLLSPSDARRDRLHLDWFGLVVDYERVHDNERMGWLPSAHCHRHG